VGKWTYRALPVWAALAAPRLAAPQPLEAYLAWLARRQ
jgi:hypothetical protein